MSRGFVKEDDLEHAGTDLLERPVSSEPNYVTPTGLKQLQDELQKLDDLRLQLMQKEDDPFAAQQLAETARDLRYYAARLENAELVDTAKHPQDEIRFGAMVNVEDEQGQLQEFIIVGEDEADIAHNKVSWASPLAKALIGHKVGETVSWKRPAGNTDLEITAIRYR